MPQAKRTTTTVQIISLTKPEPAKREGFEHVWVSWTDDDAWVEFIQVNDKIVYEFHKDEYIEMSKERNYFLQGVANNLETAHTRAKRILSHLHTISQLLKP